MLYMTSQAHVVKSISDCPFYRSPTNQTDPYHLPRANLHMKSLGQKLAKISIDDLFVVG